MFLKTTTKENANFEEDPILKITRPKSDYFKKYLK
jgi:hypothetical protein